MKWKWTFAGILCAATAVAQMSERSESFMQMMTASMTRMNHDMAAAPMNHNSDGDFAAMMLPHHQGAIDMAKAELRFGKDPVMRRLAQEIIVEQASEMDAMKLWLDKSAESTAKEK